MKKLIMLLVAAAAALPLLAATATVGGYTWTDDGNFAAGFMAK